MTFPLTGPSVRDPSRTIPRDHNQPHRLLHGPGDRRVLAPRVYTASLSWLATDGRSGATGSVRDQILVR
ncbi:hypothetical protein [Polyangium mundeleinium]|uniref:Uncharacterized protein n=1 Tax=Polyangium mundeleinium TaxID=2995306 RepID=A0ABT5F3E7_9BACT|nr:hypothetical protein [Polyangium mundeleinium]MDC0748622.1 hypothetical protein [Polyangium mundeleinium]